MTSSNLLCVCVCVRRHVPLTLHVTFAQFLLTFCCKRFSSCCLFVVVNYLLLSNLIVWWVVLRPLLPFFARVTKKWQTLKHTNTLLTQTKHPLFFTTLDLGYYCVIIQKMNAKTLSFTPHANRMSTNRPKVTHHIFSMTWRCLE